MAKRQAKVLSDPQLRAWMTAGTPVAKSDGDGLTFTLSKAGTAAWVLRYRINGQRREVTLGNYPDLSLAAARDKASKSRLRVSDGVDVAAMKRREKHASIAAWTVRQLAEDYERAVLAESAPSTQKLYGLYLKNWVKPRLGSLIAVDVVPADVRNMLKSSAEKGTGAMRTLHAVTRAVFEHGVNLDLFNTNPAAGIKRKAIKKAKKARKGATLSGDALATFLRSIPDDPKGWALRLHLMTGVRPGELCEARQDEFDVKAGTWTLPGDRIKTGNGYTITLPPQATELVRKLLHESRGSDYLLPASRGDDKAVPYQTYRAWLWRATDKAGIARGEFKPHDLRRTMRSGLATLGVRYEVAERAINHKLPELAEIYDRNDYATERKAALTQWANYLDGLTVAENVTPIKGRKSA